MYNVYCYFRHKFYSLIVLRLKNLFTFLLFFKQVFGWPTKSGMSEVVVRAICGAFISSSNAAQSCKDVPGVDDEVANENCVEDIQVIILCFLFVFNESCLQLQLISTVA